MVEPTPSPDTGTAAREPEYEFSEEQNKTIATVASGFWLLGIILLIQGTKVAIRCVGVVMTLFKDDPPTRVGWTQAIAYGALALLLFPLGIWFFSAAGSFQAIVDTKGRDIKHLMAGLSSLANSFAWITAIALFAVAVGLVVFLLNLFGVV